MPGVFVRFVWPLPSAFITYMSQSPSRSLRNACLLPVRRPCRLRVRPGLVGEPRLIAAVGVHHVDLRIASVAKAGERDSRVAGRHRRVHVGRSVDAQVHRAGAVRVHGVDLVVGVAPAREHHLSVLAGRGGLRGRPGSQKDRGSGQRRGSACVR